MNCWDEYPAEHFVWRRRPSFFRCAQTGPHAMVRLLAVLIEMFAAKEAIKKFMSNAGQDQRCRLGLQGLSGHAPRRLAIATVQILAARRDVHVHHRFLLEPP